MTPEEYKKKMIEITDLSLRRCCSKVNRDLILRRIEIAPADVESLRVALRKVRIAIRLFIDEDLGNDLYAELTALLDQMHSG